MEKHNINGFRIGNLLTYKGDSYVVDEIVFSSFDNRVYLEISELDQDKPIPASLPNTQISVDLLEVEGFEITQFYLNLLENSIQRLIDSLNKQKMLYKNRKGEMIAPPIYVKDGIVFFDKCGIKFHHQLQNMYDDLKNNCLTL